MSSNTYKDYKFTVEQVELMTKLYDSGLTANGVVSGFRQIKDFESKFGSATSPQGSINENRLSSFSSSQTNNTNQSSSHSFVSPKSGINSRQNVSNQTKTPTSVKTSSTPSMVSSHPTQGETPQGKTNKGKRKKSSCNVVVNDSDEEIISQLSERSG